MNNVNLIGYLGKDFEVGNTSGGKLYAKNSLAITKRWKNEKGNDESSTTWIPIVLFGKSAESASMYIKKGSQFACSGELSSSQYTDEQGNVKTTLSVGVISMENLSVEELADKMGALNYEKLIKALFLFEKNSSMEKLTANQKRIVLDEAYQFYMDNKYISSFLQENINQILEDSIDKELSKKQEKTLER